MNERLDYYVWMTANGEFSEFHVLATPEQADELRKALDARFTALAYDDFEADVDIGGEYKYILEPGVSIADIAKEMVYDGGWDTEG